MRKWSRRAVYILWGSWALQLHGSVALGVGRASPELPAGILAGLGCAQDGGLAALRAGGNVIRRISRSGRMELLLFALTLRQARGSKLLAVAATANKLLFQRGNLLVEQVVGLVNQANQGIGAHRGIGMLEPRSVERPALMIRQISQIRRIFLVPLGHFAHGLRLARVGWPLRKPPVAQEIFVVEQELLQAGARGVEQSQFGLGRRRGGATAFGDVLAA